MCDACSDSHGTLLASILYKRPTRCIVCEMGPNPGCQGSIFGSVRSHTGAYLTRYLMLVTLFALQKSYSISEQNEMDLIGPYIITASTQGIC